VAEFWNENSHEFSHELLTIAVALGKIEKNTEMRWKTMAKATKLPSGNWRCKAYYTDEYGERKSKSFTADTKYDAERAAKNYLADRKHFAKTENRTLGELADINPFATTPYSPLSICAWAC